MKRSEINHQYTQWLLCNPMQVSTHIRLTSFLCHFRRPYRSLFEPINLSIYQPSARRLAFCTSESRLLRWICVFKRPKQPANGI